MWKKCKDNESIKIINNNTYNIDEREHSCFYLEYKQRYLDEAILLYKEEIVLCIN